MVEQPLGEKPIADEQQRNDNDPLDRLAKKEAERGSQNALERDHDRGTEPPWFAQKFVVECSGYNVEMDLWAKHPPGLGIHRLAILCIEGGVVFILKDVRRRANQDYFVMEEFAVLIILCPGFGR